MGIDNYKLGQWSRLFIYFCVRSYSLDKCCCANYKEIFLGSLLFESSIFPLLLRNKVRLRQLIRAEGTVYFTHGITSTHDISAVESIEKKIAS